MDGKPQYSLCNFYPKKKKKSKKRALPVGMIGVIDGGIDY